MSLRPEIDDLQARVAFQEDLLATLSERVAAQDRVIEILQTQLREVHRKLGDAMYQLEQSAPAMPLEKPPHY